MKRIAPLVIAVGVVAFSCPVIVSAQRGGAHGTSAHGGRATHASSSQPPAQPIPSLDHPLPYNFNAVRPAPVPGRAPIPAPFDVRPGFYNRQHPLGIPYGYGYGSAYDNSSDYGDTYATPPPAQEETGLLFLDVTPASAAVYADSAFVGSVEDLRSGLRLSPGHHWIDLDAGGYDKKTFEINVTPGQPVRYRTALSVLRAATLAPSASHPQTMYAIAGCYGGNTPPVQADLPKGCDIAKVRVIRPPQ